MPYLLHTTFPISPPASEVYKYCPVLGEAVGGGSTGGSRVGGRACEDDLRGRSRGGPSDEPGGVKTTSSGGRRDGPGEGSI